MSEVCAHIMLRFLSLCLGAAMCPALSAAATDGVPLRWAPPPLDDPQIVFVPRGFFVSAFGHDEDVLFVMPGYSAPDGTANPEGGARIADFEVSGGRNLRLIGGENGPGRMMFKNVSGSIFVEGLSIRPDGEKDALNVAGLPGSRPDVYLQNVRVDGVRGSFDGVHGDILQPQGPVGAIRIDRMTGSSGYQGLFLAPQAPIASIDIAYTNLFYDGRFPDEATGAAVVSYLLWLSEPGRPRTPVRLEEVWIEPRPGQSLAKDAVWPVASVPSGVLSEAEEEVGGARVCWPPDMRVDGCVRDGRPPGGDFVPADIGAAYTSPGYR